RNAHSATTRLNTNAANLSTAPIAVIESVILLYTAHMRKRLVLLLAALCLVPTLRALEREPWPAFAGRRSRLLEKLSDGVIVLFAYTELEGSSLRTAFRQESNFYYLTGWNQPGAILLLIHPLKEKNSPVYDEVSRLPRQILYLPSRNPKQE